MEGEVGGEDEGTVSAFEGMGGVAEGRGEEGAGEEVGIGYGRAEDAGAKHGYATVPAR